MKLDRKRLCWDLAKFSCKNGIDSKDFDRVIEYVFRHPEIWKRYLKDE